MLTDILSKILDLKSQLLESKNQENQTDETQGKETQSTRKQTLKEKVDVKTTSILKNLDDIKTIKKKLRKDYVPSVVISNLNQTIKDLEVCITFQVLFN